MDLELAGKRALITGASQGIGRQVAETLAREGCDVLLTARHAERLNEASKQIGHTTGRSATSLAIDLTAEGAIAQVADFAGSIDILVNNAGAIPPGTLSAVDSDTWRKAWDLKVFGFIDLTRALYPRLAETKGAVVNVIGYAGESFPPAYIAGAAGNASLMAFTKALAKQAHTDGVRVNAINPGPIATERNTMLLRARAEAELGDPDRYAELTAAMPYGRAGTVDEIADAVAFLASPRSAYTNGAILAITGGG